MRFGIWMEVGILEKSRRLRIARISLGMLSPENLPSRPPGCDCQHRTAGYTREGRALALPSGFGTDCAIAKGLRVLPPSTAEDPCAECLAVWCGPAWINLETFTICRR